MDSNLTDSSTWRSRLFWKLQFIGWGGLIPLAILFMSVGYFDLRSAILIGIFRALCGFTLTCGLRCIYQRLQQTVGSIWLKGVIVFVICGAFGLLDSVATGVFSRALELKLESNRVESFLAASAFMRWMLYWMWSLLYFGINYWLDTQHAKLRMAQAETEARTGELRLLRAQVNPHFLFNALNSILAESDHPAHVRSLTQALADYLRFSLVQDGETQPLGVELDALENYLRVEKVRFEEKLEYRIDADQPSRNAPAPIALVQPLLENAIKYGQRTSTWPLKVNVSTTLKNRELEILVENSGKWVDPENSTSTGTGLANLRRRLQLLYADKASLATEAVDGNVRVLVRLPAVVTGGGSL